MLLRLRLTPASHANLCAPPTKQNPLGNYVLPFANVRFSHFSDLGYEVYDFNK